MIHINRYQYPDHVYQQADADVEPEENSELEENLDWIAWSKEQRDALLNELKELHEKRIALVLDIKNLEIAKKQLQIDVKDLEIKKFEAKMKR